MPLKALSPEVFKGEVDNSVLSYRNTSPVFISLNLKKKSKKKWMLLFSCLFVLFTSEFCF